MFASAYTDRETHKHLHQVLFILMIHPHTHTGHNIGVHIYAHMLTCNHCHTQTFHVQLWATDLTNPVVAMRAPWCALENMSLMFAQYSFVNTCTISASCRCSVDRELQPTYRKWFAGCMHSSRNGISEPVKHRPLTRRQHAVKRTHKHN